MNHQRVQILASSYVLAGIFVCMFVTFVAFDVNAVRREAPSTRGATLPPQPLRVVFRDF